MKLKLTILLFCIIGYNCCQGQSKRTGIIYKVDTVEFNGFLIVSAPKKKKKIKILPRRIESVPIDDMDVAFFFFQEKDLLKKSFQEIVRYPFEWEANRTEKYGVGSDDSKVFFRWLLNDSMRDNSYCAKWPYDHLSDCSNEKYKGREYQSLKMNKCKALKISGVHPTDAALFSGFAIDNYNKPIDLYLIIDIGSATCCPYIEDPNCK